MKKLLLGTLLFFSFAASSQKLTYTKDIMTDKEYINIDKVFMASNDSKNGFFIKPTFKILDGVVKYNGLIVISSGVGSCMENDRLIILFEDNTKVELKSWQNFNCKGTSYFDLHSKELENLNKRVKAIRLTNGRSYESYTFETKTEEEKNYFIIANTLLINQKYEVSK